MNRLQPQTKIRRVLSRMFALLLVCGLCAPLLTLPGSAAGSDVLVLADSTISVWEWKRVYTQDDLPESEEKVPILLQYTSNGTHYIIDGNKYYRRSGYDGRAFYFVADTTFPKGVEYAADHFMTTEDVSHLSMHYDKKDGDNENAKRYFFYSDDIGFFTSHHDNYLMPRYTFVHISPEESDTVITHDLDVSRPNEGAVKIFHNVTGVDYVWVQDGDRAGAHRNGFTYGDEFIMYIGEKKSYSALTHDFTVQSGQVLNVDGEVYIAPDVTLTVEPGAVLSIQGNVFNNGFIYNQGDMLLQDNATIQTLMLEGDGGAITCDGGDLILMSGARLITGSCSYSEQYGNGFLMKNGANCTNYGTIVLPVDGRFESGAILENRKGGLLMQGYEMEEDKDGKLHHYNQSELQQGTALSSTYMFIYTTMFQNLNGNLTSLYLGHDVLAINKGTILMNGNQKIEADAELRQEGTLTNSDMYQKYQEYLEYLNWKPKLASGS